MTRIIDKEVFLTLLKAGLWEKEVQLAEYNSIDFAEVMRIAEEQSVVGLITAGLARVKDMKIPQAVVLQYVGATLQIEQRNKIMNSFLAEIMVKLQEEGIYAILVKGQGVAQCYEKPLWRASGDVDLVLDNNNYNKAKNHLLTMSDSQEEVKGRKHIELSIEGWIVELHGSLRGDVLRRIDKEIDETINEVLNRGKVRVWKNGTVDVYLPAHNEDVILIFTHIIQHFVQGGIGLRQICDWCRLLWTYKESLNRGLLEQRIKNAGLMTEWMVFGSMAVNYLGMPIEAMPFYKKAGCYLRKARRLLSFIMKTGNMGHNRDTSYYARHSYVVSKLISLWRHFLDTVELFFIFPLDSVKILGRTVVNGMKRL